MKLNRKTVASNAASFLQRESIIIGMKKIILLLFSTSLIFCFFVPIANAQTNLSQGDNQDIQSGQKLYSELVNKKISCEKLKDSDFEKIGEFLMEQQIGNSERHALMNQMMQNMMSQNGEEQMHIVIGKRGTGCDTNALMPQHGDKFLPMMGMNGNWNNQDWRGGANSMMGFGFGNMMGWGGFGLIGLLWMVLFWVLLVLAVVALFRYIGGFPKRIDDSKSPLNILKERYAKGEIDKKEYEEKKRGLG